MVEVSTYPGFEAAFRSVIDTAIATTVRIHEMKSWLSDLEEMAARPQRSAMHAAYRAKTRRRNRR